MTEILLILILFVKNDIQKTRGQGGSKPCEIIYIFKCLETIKVLHISGAVPNFFIRLINTT